MRREAILGTALLALLPAAHAQQPATAERIEVTGSNIKRVEVETASAVTVITREELARSGQATVAEYLQSLTFDGQGSLPASFGNGYAFGATAVSLRGLGAAATLVLVNGRRLAAYPLPDDGQRQFTDLSGIPKQAVERIEILKSGASSIYGSDAMAGVVNIILRREYVGAEATASWGESRYHDARRSSASLLVGHGELARDGFNVFAQLEVRRSDEVHLRDRERQWIGKGDLREWGYTPIGATFINGIAIPGRLPSPSTTGTLVVRGANGTRIVGLPGCEAFSTLPAIEGVGDCPIDVGRTFSMLPSIEATSLYGRGTYRVTEAIDGYAEFGFSRNRTGFDIQTYTSVTPILPTPTGLRDYRQALILPATHPDNPLGATGFFDVAQLGIRRREARADASRVLVGIKGAHAGWDFDVGYLHTATELRQVARGGVVDVNALIDAVGNPANPLYPYRIGVNASLNAPGAVASIAPVASATAHSRQDLLDAKASTELADLAGGPLSVAVGAEARRLSFVSPPLSAGTTGDLNLALQSFRGEARAWSAYVEGLAPLFPWLELTAAARHDRYDRFSATTPKVGVRIVPVHALLLRATYAEGFRAPSVPEGSSDSQFPGFTPPLADPVRCPNGTPAPGAIRADCTVSVAAVIRGNPALGPERSRSWNAGLVWEPLTGTSIGIDGWVIRRNGEIGILPLEQALLRDDAVRGDDNLPGIPHSGTLVAITAPYTNAGYTQVVGFDVDATHRMRLPIGDVPLVAQWTRTNSSRRVDVDGLSAQFAGTHGNCDISNCPGTPRDRVRLVAAFDRGPFDATLTWTWRSPLDNVAQRGAPCASAFADDRPAPEGCRLGGFNTFDASVRWRPLRDLELSAAMLNVADRVAPLDPLTYGTISYNPTDGSGALGRMVALGLRYRFR